MSYDTEHYYNVHTFLEDEINEYDENLYEILTDYVTDTVGSYTALQEFIHDRHAMEWIDD